MTCQHRPGVVQASLVLAFLLVVSAVCAVLSGCSSPATGQRVNTPDHPADSAPEAPSRFAATQLPGAQGETVWALQRGPVVPPLRYRVVVIPGSGCAGMGAMADLYFRGLLHAQVTVLHKPGVHPADATPSHPCSRSFVASDSLAWWRAHARVAVGQLIQAHAAEAPSVPWLLVGISEGAELLPTLAEAVTPGPAGVVMVASSGLDPRDAGRMQAERMGYRAAWDALARAQAGTGPDSLVLQGRSLRYWRDLWQWPVQQPLLQGPWPLLQAWGDADELVPSTAYEQFAQQALHRHAPYCALRVPGADHGLQTAGVDGVQRLWSALESWGRTPQSGLCAHLTLR